LRPPLRDQNLTTGLAGGTMPSTGPKSPEPIGAPHACEIEYAMGNLHLVNVFAWTPDDYKVSETMMNYFANFIKTGNPNGQNLPEWNKVLGTDSNPALINIDVVTKSETGNDARYLFHDRSFGNKK
jgi:para-nitrobenzyl esterase